MLYAYEIMCNPLKYNLIYGPIFWNTYENQY